MSHSTSVIPPGDQAWNKSQPLPKAPAAIGLDASDVALKSESIYGTRKAPLTLDIVVIGCGIGGLCAAFCLTQAGHRVTIVESTPVLGEVGAGIVLGPNSSRLLRRWGLRNHLDEIAVKPGSIALRKYNTGELLGLTKLDEPREEEYGAPTYFVHRADLHKLLYDLVAPHVTVRLGSAVVGCDPDSVLPSVTLVSGEVIKADLIIGADGIRSYTRQTVLGKPTPVEPTGDAAYRAMIPTSLLLQDPELREFIEPPHMTAWLAPGRHMVAYTVRKNEVLNLVLSHPDDGSVESWTAEGNVDQMRCEFDDFEPRVRKLLAFVQSTLKLRLLDRSPLDKWIHESAPVALLGDACHPMLPYRAQGAATAMEDGAVLGNLLSRVSHRSQLRALLQAYQDLRLPRTAAAQLLSRRYQHIYHLPDGPEQRARDENLRQAMTARNPGASQHEPDGNRVRSADEESNVVLLSYDADAEVDKWWADHGKKVEALVPTL